MHGLSRSFSALLVSSGLVVTTVFLTSSPARAAIAPSLAQAYAHDVDAEIHFCDIDDVAKHGSDEAVTLSGGRTVHFVRSTCGCGASNCSIGGYVLDGSGYRKVVMNTAQAFKALPSGSLVMTGESSAALSVRSTYRWTGSTYARVVDTMIYLGKYEKAIAPIKFSPGASSAMLHGNRVTQSFGDEFVFDANAGQRVTLTFLRRNPQINSISLYMPDGDKTLTPTRTGETYSWTLPGSGSYNLIIEARDDAAFRSYEGRFAIH